MSSTPTADKAPQLHASAHRGALSPQVRSARPAADKAPRAQPTASPATRAHRLAPGAAVPPDCPGNRPWHIGQPSARAVKWSRRAAVAVGPAVGGDAPARHDAWAPVQRELAAARPGGGRSAPNLLHASAHHGALSPQVEAGPLPTCLLGDRCTLELPASHRPTALQALARMLSACVIGRLRENRLSDADVAVLAMPMVAPDYGLVSLDLRGNALSAIGGRALGTALRSNGSLAELRIDSDFALPIFPLKG